MSRRKAIEAAVDQAEIKWGQDSYRVINAVTLAAARAYDLGRIAGLREAARITKASSDWWHPMIGEVRALAASLSRRLKP